MSLKTDDGEERRLLLRYLRGAAGTGRVTFEKTRVCIKPAVNSVSVNISTE
jgi:hypothetical protein